MPETSNHYICKVTTQSFDSYQGDHLRLCIATFFILMRMKSFNKSLWVILWLFIAIKAQAQESVTLRQLLQRVSQTAPSLQTDSAAIVIKQAQAIETRHNWLPSLKLNYQTDIGTNNNDAGPYFGFGIIPSSSRGVRTNSNTQLGSTNIGVAALDWEIYNFGAYEAQNRVAKSDVEVQQHQFTQSKYQLQAFTIGNYFQLVRLYGLYGHPSPQYSAQ